ncbi:MAG: hypothetical protein IKD41_05880, partial [Alistipes sp.]|nr:hypothetical protein [Alistipes sp.]
ALDGEYYLVKTDILGKTMTFSSSKESMSNLVTVPVWRVKEILAANRNGEKVDSIVGESVPRKAEEPTYRTEEDSITRFDKSRRKKRKGKGGNSRQHAEEYKEEQQPQQEPQNSESQPAEHRHNGRGRNNRNFRHNRNRRPNQQGEKQENK